MSSRWLSFHDVVDLVRAGHVKAVKEWVGGGGSQSATGPAGTSLLIEACRAKEIGVAAFLVKAGAKVTHRDDYLLDALHYAIEPPPDDRPVGDVEVPPKFGFFRRYVPADDPELAYALATLLLDAGAELNPKKVERLRLPGKIGYRTPLQQAAGAGNRPLVDELLRRGALVDDCDYYGTTPLGEAIVRGWPDCVRALLDAGADLLQRQGVSREGLFHLACRHAAQTHSERAREAQKGRRRFDPAERDRLCARYEAVMEVLVERGALTGGLDDTGWSAWDSAVVFDAPDRILERMAALGTPLDPRRRDGRPLHSLAALAKADEDALVRMARALRRLGADIHARDVEGRTPAEVAAGCGLARLAAALSDE